MKDKEKVETLRRYGDIVYISPILNIAGVEVKKSDVIFQLERDPNIISAEFEDEGSLLVSR
ncbi:hypothetical protein [Paenibacillus sp. FSL H3-0302]|uniref:hypothetical protein n=1 Tax=Paenibacillus sp. FSL H3-0302 TaxID=2921428 RepID=UPI0030ED043B